MRLFLQQKLVAALYSKRLLFKAALKLATLERGDKGEYQRLSTLCTFKNLIHLIDTDPSACPDDWTILNNIVAVILDVDAIEKGTDNVCHNSHNSKTIGRPFTFTGKSFVLERIVFSQKIYNFI